MKHRDSAKLPKGVKRVLGRLADGSRREYYYYKGARLDGGPGTAEFARSIRLADQRAHFTAAPAPGVRQLIDDFRISPEYRATAPGTKRKREAQLAAIERRFGWMLVPDLNERAVRDEFYRWRDELAANNGLFAADSHVQALTRLLGWAYDRGRINVNHARGIQRLSPERGRADKIWTPAQEKIFLDRAPPSWCDAYLVALFTVAREGDMIAFDRRQYDGEWLTFQPEKTRGKTGVRVQLPICLMPPLQAVLARAPAEGRLLRTPHGNPWSKSHFTSEFAALKRKVGLGEADLHWHDIRGTGISRMQAAGCTDAEVSAITGHAMGRGTHLASYAARTRELAENAYRKWASAMGTGPKVVSIFHRPRK